MEKTGNHLGAPEAHLTPGKHITHEGRSHHEQEDNQAKQPHHFARRFIRAIKQAAENVEINHDKEEAGAIGMCIKQETTGIHVTNDMFDAVECDAGIGGIMNGERSEEQTYELKSLMRISY